MAKHISISNFRKNLKEYQKDMMKFHIDNIADFVYCILWQIAKHTIVDTGQARSSIIKKFAKKYNKNTSDLEQQFMRYWQYHGYPENADRDWGKADSTMSENLSGNIYKIDLTIKDDGLYNQEYNVGGKYPSKNISRDNSNFMPRHISYVRDLVNAGNFGILEKLNYDKLVDKFAQDLEDQLFK